MSTRILRGGEKVGNLYRFKCPNCGFEKEYRDGGRFFTKEYYDESKKLSSEFKSNIENGKYGLILKAMALADEKGELYYDCDTHLYQCTSCYALNVYRGKRVYRNGICNLTPKFDSNYELSAEIEQYCPVCSKGKIKRVDTQRVIRPECKNELLNMLLHGKWD